MLDDDAHHYAAQLKSAATELIRSSAQHPYSFSNAYSNGREVSVGDLTEAVERVAYHHRAAISEASFHSQDPHSSPRSSVLAREWSSTGTVLAQVSLDLTQAVEVASHLADARTRAPETASTFEKQAADEVARLLANARTGIDRAVDMMFYSADYLTGRRPLPTPDLAKLFATPAELGPASERERAALSRSSPVDSAAAGLRPRSSPPRSLLLRHPGHGQPGDDGRAPAAPARTVDRESVQRVRRARPRCPGRTGWPGRLACRGRARPVRDPGPALAGRAEPGRHHRHQLG